MPDLIATATVLTAATVAHALLRAASRLVSTLGGRTACRHDCRRGTHECVRHCTDLIVSGGGVHNPQIMSHLAGFLPGIAISTSTDHGIDADAKEAIAFAVLAHQTWCKKPSNLPSATGARHAVVLGNITF
jgi:anhydro-N-acetylmuramic acid kinase